MSETPIPFEIHITTTDLLPDQVDLFRDVCLQNQAKPLLIELAQGEHTKQPMFSKVIQATCLEEAVGKSSDYASVLLTEGFRVERIKIEIPSLYADRFRAHPGVTNKPYFEWHGKIKLDRTEPLLGVCLTHQAHLSRNSLKDEPTIRFITVREYGAKESFQQRLDALINSLQQGGWPILKQQSEYCLYDTNTLLDKGWLPNTVA